jgi:hypothetical protein
MSTLTIILLYGVPASLLFSAIVFAMEWVNPRLMLRPTCVQIDNLVLALKARCQT